jgi:hypothetical protein
MIQEYGTVRFLIPFRLFYRDACKVYVPTRRARRGQPMSSKLTLTRNHHSWAKYMYVRGRTGRAVHPWILLLGCLSSWVHFVGVASSSPSASEQAFKECSHAHHVSDLLPRAAKHMKTHVAYKIVGGVQYEKFDILLQHLLPHLQAFRKAEFELAKILPTCMSHLSMHICVGSGILDSESPANISVEWQMYHRNNNCSNC